MCSVYLDGATKWSYCPSTNYCHMKTSVLSIFYTFLSCVLGGISFLTSQQAVKVFQKINVFD